MTWENIANTKTHWAVLSDFDHTVTMLDVTDTLLEIHALPQWHDIEKLWEKGEIGSLECMQRQIALLRASPQQVEAVAESIKIDPHFKTFATLCANNNIPLVILSDGLDFVIRHILKREGLSHLHVIASHLAHTHDDRWELTAPFSNAACTSQASTCKCTMARQIQTITQADKLLYIGDGRSDFCVSMQEADFILAKDSLLTYCQQQQLPHQSFKTFAQATQTLESLIERQDLPLTVATTEDKLYA